MMHVLQIIMTLHFTIQKQAQSYRHKTVSHSVCLWYPLFSYIGLLIFSIFLLFPSSNGTFPHLPMLLVIYFLHFKRHPLVTK